MTPLEELARALAQTGELLHQIYGHMDSVAAAGHVAPEAPPPPIVLFQLLVDVLEERFENVHEADLTTAVELLDAVGDAMETDLYLMPVEAPAPALRRPRGACAGRRRGRWGG
jgi:hypothetical protein